MKQSDRSHLPRKRKSNLVVDELAEEVLVYDLDRHKAHCLNPTAAAVWQSCDGESTANQISKRVTQKLQKPFSEDLVWLALRQLETRHLLATPALLPARLAGISRREMIRNLGIAAAVAVPLITSIIAPTPAQANTCLPGGAQCSASADCCSKICQGNNTCM